MQITDRNGLLTVMRDPNAMTSVSEDIDTRLSETQKEAARRVICTYAQGATLAEQIADAEELMKALGVHPSQDDEVDYAIGPVSMMMHTPHD